MSDNYIFQKGFLGTQAPFFMDVVFLFFSFLPFLMLITIIFAINKRYKLHMISQGVVLAITTIVVLFFEVTIRLYGGFVEFIDEGFKNYELFILFLVVHILIALASYAGWVYLFIKAYKDYKKNGFYIIKNSNHQKIGKYIFIFMSISCIMGGIIYFILFY